MSGGAVELALALHRLPTMRRALRERALPPDVGDLLKLVGGSPAALARTAVQHGEQPAAVLEAARFFVQEVLLFPGADAYRVLGLEPSASDVQVKAHYRALQQWLHPDRRGNDPESAYATRINGAWSHLRNPDRRRAYDTVLAADRSHAALATAANRVHVSAWPSEAARPAHWKAMAPATVALGFCIWLAWLASREPAPYAAPGRGAFFEEVASPGEPAIALTASVRPRPARATLAEPSPGLPTALPGMPRSRGEPLLSTPPPRVTATAAVASPTPALAPAPVVTAAPTRMPASPGPPAPIALVAAAPIATPPPRAERPAAAVPVRAALPVVPAALAVAAPGRAPDIYMRAQAADRRAQQLWSYLAGRLHAPPPIWRDVAALDAADRVLLQLGPAASPARGPITFAGPQWRIGQDSAEVRVRVQTPHGTDAPTSTIHATLGWRGDQWWVEQVTLEPGE